MRELVRLAAQNNAQWCNRVCRSHGHPGRFTDKLWLAYDTPPPFYPNIVTLAEVVDGPLHDAMPLVSQARDGAPFAIKDSFASLDLGVEGAQLLFEASWIHRSADTLIGPPSSLDWRRVSDETELHAWAEGWGGSDPSGADVFKPALLADPTVTLIGGFDGDTVLAGAALNRSEGVLGWSNVFLPDEDHEDHLYGLLELAERIADGRPLVGYEQGEALWEAISVGFAEIGELQVWLYPARGI